jgi:hypothetical protein
MQEPTTADEVGGARDIRRADPQRYHADAPRVTTHGVRRRNAMRALRLPPYRRDAIWCVSAQATPTEAHLQIHR